MNLEHVALLAGGAEHAPRGVRVRGGGGAPRDQGPSPTTTRAPRAAAAAADAAKMATHTPSTITADGREEAASTAATRACAVCAAMGCDAAGSESFLSSAMMVFSREVD